MLVATALVLMMSIPGLALFYGGMVRSKNMLSILMQVFAIFHARHGAVGDLRLQHRVHRATPYFGGLDRLFLKGICFRRRRGKVTRRRHLGLTVPEYLYVVFQATFAAITSASSSARSPSG